MLAPKSKIIESPIRFGQIEAIEGLLISVSVLINKSEKVIKAPVFPNDNAASEYLFETDSMVLDMLEFFLYLIASDGTSFISTTSSQ